MIKKIISILMIIFIFTCVAILAEEEEILYLNLQDCINMAMETSSSIIKAEQNVVIAEANTSQSLSTFYPSVGLYGNYSKTNQGTTTVSGITASTTRQSQALTFGIKQTVFDSFQTWYKYKYYRIQVEQQKYNLENEKATLALNVTQAYFNVISAKYLMELDEVLLEQSIKHLEQAKANYEAGISPGADIFSAEVDVTESRVNLLESQNDFRTKMAKLKNYIGIKRDVEIEIDEEFFELKDELLLDDAINSALARRPDLQALITQVEAQDRQIDILELGKYPSLSINVGYYSDITRDPSIPENYYTISADLSFPIFDGFNTDSRIESAEASRVIYEAQKTDLIKSISLEVETSYYALETAFAKIKLTSQQVEEAKKKLEVAEGRYEAGVGSFQEVLDAQVSYNQSMNNLLTARYDYQTALFTFKKAIGEELL